MTASRRLLEPPLAWGLTLVLVAACRPAEEAPSSQGRRPSGAEPELAAPVLETGSVGSTTLFQAISPVSESVIWLGGHDGAWARTLDGGGTWEVGTVAGHETLQFRDVQAFGDGVVVLMSAGEGPASRIFRTADAGRSWTEVFAMDHPAGFLDCMDFWDEATGVAYGDAVDGSLYLLRTEDGGRSWTRVGPAGLPGALPGEGGFAASGTCMRTGDGGKGWVATGNGDRPRLLTTGDAGRSWAATELPLAPGPGRGASTVGFRSDGLGFALGGDLGGGSEGPRVALSTDGGSTWSSGGDIPFPGAVYGAAWVPDRVPATLFAVGPGGMAWSQDGGHRWSPLDTLAYWAVEFASRNTGWATGPGGRVTRIRLPDR